MIRLMVLSLLVVAGVAGLGCCLSGACSLGWRRSPLVFCASLNLVASWIAFVPVATAAKLSRKHVPHASLIAMMVRLSVVFSGTLVAMVSGPWAVESLSIWMAAFYLSLLLVETILILWVFDGCDDSGGKTALR